MQDWLVLIADPAGQWEATVRTDNPYSAAALGSIRHDRERPAKAKRGDALTLTYTVVDELGEVTDVPVTSWPAGE